MLESYDSYLTEAQVIINDLQILVFVYSHVSVPWWLSGDCSLEIGTTTKMNRRSMESGMLLSSQTSRRGATKQ